MPDARRIGTSLVPTGAHAMLSVRPKWLAIFWFHAVRGAAVQDQLRDEPVFLLGLCPGHVVLPVGTTKTL